MEAADRGAFLSSEAVGAWMDDWGTEREGPVPETDIGPSIGPSPRPAGDAAP